MTDYLLRTVDATVEARLRTSPVLVLEGPRAVGKTSTGLRHSTSQVSLDRDIAARQLAEVSAARLLEGDVPRQLDEWQTVPHLWNEVRHEADRRQTPGQFILTGSATPADDETRHTGTGRFSRLRLRPLAWWESGFSSSSVSISDVFAGGTVDAADPGATLGEVAERVLAGGWPQAVRMSTADACGFAADYLDQMTRMDVTALTGRRTDPTNVRRLVASLARNTATEVSVATLVRDTGGSERSLARDTVNNYLDALRRTFLLDEQAAWAPRLRSSTRLRKAPKRHLADTSLTCAALRVTSPDRLIGDPHTFGFVFESLVHQLLATAADQLRASVEHYRDESGLECDAVVDLGNGAWSAWEVKLGHAFVDQAAQNLLALAERVSHDTHGPPANLVVVVPTGPSYRRRDGVSVVAASALAA